METITIVPGKMDLATLRDIYKNPCKITIDPEAKTAVDKSVALIQEILSSNQTVYGVNTGFGLLAEKKIPQEDLKLLQKSLVLSHSAGVGAPVNEQIARLIMVLKVNSLARGFSGIRYEVIDALVKIINAGITPIIPQKGSVGASGDLAPLAHMARLLIGEGEALFQGKLISAVDALNKAGLKPVELEAKEGLALLNGTQVSTAYALKGLFDAESLFAAATGIGAMTVEATFSSRAPFDPRIHEVRGQNGQIEAAGVYRSWLKEESEFSNAHHECGKVQDPYSIRCQPQVMGAILDNLHHATAVLLAEANAVTDNPLIFQDNGDVISGGNFHAEPVAFASDIIALAIAEIGSLSERRISLLVDTHLSGLPPFLVQNSGVNSGFMIAQVSAAALTSQNRSLAVPASVESLPTSANQEDHVSMATNGGLRLWEMADNTKHILAIEYLGAAQGMDLRGDDKSTEPIEIVRQALRNVVPFYDKDRYFAADIEKANQLIHEDLFLASQVFTDQAIL